MKKNRRFLVGLVGVAAVVTFLVWTGVSETMVYYFTPTELVAMVDDDPSFHEVGIRVGGQVVPGSYEQRGQGSLEHHFVVEDLPAELEARGGEASAEPQRIPVVYRDLLPDTFTDEVEVVLEGRFRPDGVFEATTVTTKCGSRYEASAEELAG